MPSSYTPLLRLTLPADGELVGTWGQTVNTQITALEEAAIAGTATVGLVDADYTMSIANGAADVARNAVVRFTGALTAQRNITVPSSSKTYIIRNNTTGGFGLLVKTLAGTGVVVPAGQAMFIYCDGTNVMQAVSTTEFVKRAGDTMTGMLQFFGDGIGVRAANNANSGAVSLVTGANNNAALDVQGPGALSISTAFGEVMRLLSNGNVGVQLSDPEAPLSVKSNAGSLGIVIRGRTADDIGSLSFNNSLGTYNYAVVQSRPTDLRISANNKPITFFTGAAGGAERMRIGVDGHVFINNVQGLGLTGNNYLQVSGRVLAYGTGFGFRALNDSADGEITVSPFAGAGGGGQLTSGSGPLSLSAGGGERMLIQASGQIGMPNIVYPNARLSVLKAVTDATSPATAAQICVGEVTGNANYRLQLGYMITAGNRWQSSIQSYAGGGAGELILNGEGGVVGINTIAPLDFTGAGYGTVTINGATGGMLCLAKNSAEVGRIQGFAGTLVLDAVTGVMRFRAGGDERMLIAGDGNVGIGTGSTTGRRLNVRSDVVGTAAALFTSTDTAVATVGIYNNADVGNNRYVDFFLGSGATGAGGIFYDRAGGQVIYAATSDHRLKESIADLTGSGEFIDSLRPRSYVLKASGATCAGFIAHEFAEVSPNSVYGEKDGEQLQSMSASTSEVMANIIAELKSLRLRVAALGG
jgi:hypothetical protein